LRKQTKERRAPRFRTSSESSVPKREARTLPSIACKNRGKVAERERFVEDGKESLQKEKRERGAEIQEIQKILRENS
jgi:hypothetical protein